MEQKTIEIGGFKFIINSWTLTQKLQNQSIFLPLINGPLVTGIAYQGADEETMMAALVSGVLEGLKECDLISIVNVMSSTVSYIPEGSGVKTATLDSMEKDGVDVATLHLLIAAFVKVNWGEALKKDLQGSLAAIMDL